MTFCSLIRERALIYLGLGAYFDQTSRFKICLSILTLFSRFSLTLRIGERNGKW